ncbi:uncharacterized protein LOC103390804 isoform X2 [Cynoglossus semilaevis]|uniref:uncharacterized protein LOC103390804 isoform X2 n=1 Tax=Cynoglossus semilaevis TaxID=244447 RepID=UPI0004966F8A|nr:uncharacterized protein LOC103390804 isoform X2 [Cynoglossus semilaevis]
MKQMRTWITKANKEVGSWQIPPRRVRICHTSGMMTTPSLTDEDGQLLENRMIPHSEEKAKVTAEIITPPTVHRSPVHLVIHLNLLPDTCDIVSFKTENRGSQTFEPPVGVDLDYITRPAGEGKRLPTSTPSSPLLKAKPWSSASPSPSVKSRLWVEAALQRSKNIQLKHQSAQWMKEQPGDIENQLSTTGIRAQYCELVPCICHRCPSAPPSEDFLDEKSVSELYPSLSLWKTKVDAQLDMNQRTRNNPNIFHHNGITGIYV